MTDLSKTFGRRTVDAGERQRLIRDVFRRVAPRYDLMNDLMSLGIHRSWKNRLARSVAAAPGQVVVDLAGGTGDVAQRLAAADRLVIVVDPALEMMRAGRSPRDGALCRVAGTAEQLPLRDASVDALTIAFGIRNVTDRRRALAEILRVLRPGGRLLCLEFSRVVGPLRHAYELYNRWVIPLIGMLVAGDRAAYRYLVESIQRFPDQQTMCAIIRDAGFVDLHYRNFSFGIAALHVGTRPR